jgi:hypothetical protein
MRLRIPRHRVDKQPEYIPIDHPSWDLDRVEEEVADLDHEEQLEHPFFQYHLGRTRYDLDTEDDNGKTVREYLQSDIKPEVWKLRRLDMQEWYDVRALMAPGHSANAALRACRIGVVEVSGWDGPELKGLKRKGRLSSEDMETIFTSAPGELAEDGFAVVAGVPFMPGGLESLPVLIGQAVIEASAPPTSAEKKASAS